jgi:hypothetical protein
MALARKRGLDFYIIDAKGMAVILAERRHPDPHPHKLAAVICRPHNESAATYSQKSPFSGSGTSRKINMKIGPQPR